LAVEIKGKSVCVVNRADSVVTMLEGCNNLEWAASTVRKFCNGVCSSGTLDLDRTNNDITDREGAKCATCVCAMSGVEASIFCKVAQNIN
jgi:hypothetical protein